MLRLPRLTLLPTQHTQLIRRLFSRLVHATGIQAAHKVATLATAHKAQDKGWSGGCERGGARMWTGPDDQSICQLTPPPNAVIAIAPFPRASVPRSSQPVHYASLPQPSVLPPSGIPLPYKATVVFARPPALAVIRQASATSFLVRDQDRYVEHMYQAATGSVAASRHMYLAAVAVAGRTACTLPIQWSITPPGAQRPGQAIYCTLPHTV
ncbi:uncharacterized protein C8Q71DRAFT_736738 [Rhodofomes roseus]|uniref:Uncharacterized protein n=1 Tax=Rhodofomes roseus TaxID=34475 RepID=A0ABQ8KRH1_9APHY|nr:uncharacterized protein C8Q71DRAFT_736738 [Rhodofomes roseus]KAH9841403.1 hypothetical protein C8Q71DRAFT_736738 [Rhodofomes roseus]